MLKGRLSGRISFFGIVMAVILIIAAFMLILVIKEVVHKEEVSVTIIVKNDIGYPVAGASISLDGQQVASTDSNGNYTFTYTSDNQGKRRLVKAEAPDFDPAETVVNLTGKPSLITLSMQRAFASLSVVAIDSLTKAPLSGVTLYIGAEKIDTTDVNGKITIPSHRMHLHDSPVIKLEKIKYQDRVEYLYINSKDQSATLYMLQSISSEPPKPKPAIISPMAFTALKPEPQKPKPIIKDDYKPTDSGNNPPPIPPSAEQLPPAKATLEDSAMTFMSDGHYRQALEIYLGFVHQPQWQARGDFWLYSADCDLHMASDANGMFNESIIDSALTFLDEAERYQNKIAEDIFPAVVQLKRGEAWSYKCQLPAASNVTHLQEYRQKARFYLRNAITQMNNKDFTNTDFYRFAVKIRDEIENR
jgi:hypothetical protein